MSTPETPHDDDGVVIETPALAEKSLERTVPRVGTLNELIAQANGGLYPDAVEDMLEQFFGGIFAFAREHDLTAEGTLTIKIKAQVEPYGDTAFTVVPSIKLPDPPVRNGAGHAHFDEKGTLRTHRQQDLFNPKLRDKAKRPQKMRDR